MLHALAQGGKSILAFSKKTVASMWKSRTVQGSIVLGLLGIVAAWISRPSDVEPRGDRIVGAVLKETDVASGTLQTANSPNAKSGENLTDSQNTYNVISSPNAIVAGRDVHVSDSAETKADIKEIKMMLRTKHEDKLAKYERQFPLGFRLFYTDPKKVVTSEHGDLGDLVVHWDKTRLALTDETATLDMVFSTHRGSYLPTVAKVFDRHERGEQELGSFAKNRITLEVVEDLGNGLVAVVGVKPENDPQKAQAIVYGSPGLRVENARIVGSLGDSVPPETLESK